MSTLTMIGMSGVALVTMFLLVLVGAGLVGGVMVLAAKGLR